MSDTERRIAGACTLCALIALLALAGGCRKEAATAPPETAAGKSPAAEQVVPKQAKVSKPDEASQKAQSERSVTDERPAETPPKADIDSHDPKYANGSTPKIAADGRPVTVLYYPPHMFNLALTDGGADKVSVAFGTVVLVGDAGNKLAEVRIALSDSSKGLGTTGYETLAVIEPDKLRRGKTWRGSRAGMNITVEALDYGRWEESVLPESDIGWIKLRIRAEQP